MGMAFGTFGPMLASTEKHFGVSRAVAATGMSLITLAIGGLSPVLGSLLQRIPVRRAMIAGALASATGYWGLAFLESFKLALVMYGLIGVGICLAAILGPLVLVNRWFTANRAKVLSLVNLPIVLFLTPYIVAVLLPIYGRFAILAAIGTLFLLMAPLLLLLVERPHVEAGASTGGDLPERSTPATGERIGGILRNPAFWLVSLGIGVVAGSGTAFVVHIVPFGMERTMSLQSASALLSIYSGCGILGTLMMGWLADRIGPPAALVIAATIMAMLWWVLLQVSGAPLYLVAALVGVFGVPVVTLHGAALSSMFSVSALSRAMGLSYSIKLPFIFSFAPVVGLLFDRTGSYRLPFLIIATSLALAAVCFYFLRVIDHGRRRPANVPAMR